MGKLISDTSKVASYISRYVPYQACGTLFYKKYAYSVVCHRITVFQLSKFKAKNFKQYEEQMNKYNKAHEQINALLKRLDVDFRTRRTHNYTIYLNDSDAVKKIVRLHKASIISVHGPINNDHLEHISSNTKIVVKQNLLYNKYRYKITYKATASFEQDILPGILAFKESVNPDEIRFNTTIIRLAEKDETITIRRFGSSAYYTIKKHPSVRPCESCTVYLTTEDVYVMFKMMVNGDTCGDYQIITYDELECDK